MKILIDSCSTKKVEHEDNKFAFRDDVYCDGEGCQSATRYENILRVEDGKLTQQMFVEPGWTTQFDPEDEGQSKDYCPMCNR